MLASSAIALPAMASTTPVTGVASASMIANDGAAGGGIVPRTPGHLECVPYARLTSGIQIYGDAHTWWSQARGRYATGSRPIPGAVMAIRPFNNSRLGHVATVSRVVDSRTVLLSHANWSVPGEIERNVAALDVSPGNDWSEVRIWYGPSRGLGTTHWPVSGFIYNAKPGMKLSAQLSQKFSQAGQTLTHREDSRPTRKGRHDDPIGAIIAGTY
ncbi:Surface antigen [Novosphingobium sp. Rr 2-17]|nr:Surface antigen [Novosphingobium sp. Rr 2-17]